MLLVTNVSKALVSCSAAVRCLTSESPDEYINLVGIAYNEIQNVKGLNLVWHRSIMDSTSLLGISQQRNWPI